MRGWRLVSGVLAVALVAALVALGFALGDDDRTAAGSSGEAFALAAAGSQAEKAARSAVVHMTTYSSTTLATDFAWADDAGTPKFRTYYSEVSAPIKKLVLRLGSKAVGSVVDSAPKVQDVDHVTVLLFVDQVITGPDGADRQLDQPRVTMSMVRDGDRWLVDEVKLRNLSTG
ncbi:MAG: hypothetical protein JWQ74_2079 [Marmoricola sp.]|nr:hypothetical protein [Marmoricola sp.]